MIRNKVVYDNYRWCSTSYDREDYGTNLLLKELNDEGWELIQVIDKYAYFKKEIKEEESDDIKK